MADESSAEATASVDVFATDGGWMAINDMHNRMWSEMRREQLVRAKPEKLNAPVYEQLSREMIHDTYGRGEPLEKFISGIRKLAAKAPEGCPVFVSYDKETDYEGGYYYFFEVGCERPPTDEEIAARKALNAEIREVQEEAKNAAEVRERAEFERLAAKFASDSGSDRNGENSEAG